jgi:sigma-E factor negative regulatory protein RseB
MIRAAALAAAASLAAAAIPGTARADDDARAWIERMTRALAEESYSGEFEVESAGRAERLRIVHRVRDGHVEERLTSLSAEGREIVRNGDEVIAYLPDQKLAIIEHRPERSGLLARMPRFGPEVERWYEVVLEGRMAALNGRYAMQVAVHPRDGYRFGHRLWIDEGTGMPVKAELSGADGRPLERMRFTRLELRDDIADAELDPGFDRRRFRWVRQVAQPGAEAADWSVPSPPPGFRLSASAIQDMVGTPAPVSHLVFSDGLASVSLFIRAAAPGEKPPVGTGRAGSASALSTVVNGYQVTAIGEVPSSTLEALAKGLHRAPDGRR